METFVTLLLLFAAIVLALLIDTWLSPRCVRCGRHIPTFTMQYHGMCQTCLRKQMYGDEP